MRMELGVCKRCYNGDHGNPQKTAVTQDMVECARTIREYKDVIGIDSLYISMAEEGDTGGAEALPVYVASIERDQVQMNDTQLVMEDGDDNVLVYPDPDDILEVLTRNIEQIDERTRQDVSVDLSSESTDILA